MCQGMVLFGNTKPTDVGAIDAAVFLIQSCIQNNEFADAHLYASTLYEIINHKHDNKIPDDKRQLYIAKGAYMLATAKYGFAQAGGIPPQEKQKAGQEAIALARKALEIYTQLLGTEHEKVANAMGVLAEALDFFKHDDDDEVLRLYEQAKAIHTRTYGTSSLSVAVSENKMGDAYNNIAVRAFEANDLDGYIANLERALIHLIESARIHRAIGQMERAEKIARNIVAIRDALQKVSLRRTAAATVATSTAATSSSSSSSSSSLSSSSSTKG